MSVRRWLRDISRRNATIIFSLSVLVLIKGIAWAFITPPFQTPDEPAHFASVQYIAETNRIPVVRESQNGVSKEENMYLNAVHFKQTALHPNVPYSVNKQNLYRLSHTMFSKKDRTSGGSTYVSGYPPTYYWLGALAYNMFYHNSIVTRFYAVRLLSVIISLLATIGAYFIGRKLAPESRMFAVTLAIMTGLQPEFSMISASVNNDVLVDTMSVVAIWWLLATFSHPRANDVPTGHLVLGGLILGLGMLAKAEMLYVAFFTFFVILVYHLHRHDGWKKTARGLLVPFLASLAVYSWWALFSWDHYHSLLGTMGFQPHGTMSGTLLSYIHTNFLTPYGWHRQGVLWVSWYWATFGWTDTGFAQKWLHYLLAMVMVVTTASVLVTFFTRNKQHVAVAMTFVGWSLLFYIGNILFLYAIEYVYYRQYHTIMLQGRYLLTSLVPLGVVILAGLSYMIPRRWHTKMYIAVIALAVSFNVASLFLELHRYYVT